MLLSFCVSFIYATMAFLCVFNRMSLEELRQLHSGCRMKWARPSLCRTRDGLLTHCFRLANYGQIWSCGMSPLFLPLSTTRHRHPTASLHIGWWYGCHITCGRWGCPAQFVESSWQATVSTKGLGRSLTLTGTTWWWQRHWGALCVLWTICQQVRLSVTSLICRTRSCSGWSWPAIE